MFESMLYFWVSFGAILIFAEVILPGLVSIFVGLGALTVAALMHFSYINDLPSQLITWFVSSTVYIFSLRLLILRYYPSDQQKQNIDEDQAMVGQIVRVVQKISSQESGRISYGESTWPALSQDDSVFPAGTNVEIVGRNNISWIVKKPTLEEN